MAASGHCMSDHIRSHFGPFQINMQLFFLNYKMAAIGHFGCPDPISGYLRSIQIFFNKMLAILDVRKSLLAISFHIDTQL